MESLFFESSASICVNPPLFLFSISAFSSLLSIYKISLLMQLPIIPSCLYFQFCFDSPLGLYALSFPPFLRREQILNLFSWNNLGPVSFKWKTKNNLLQRVVLPAQCSRDITTLVAQIHDLFFSCPFENYIWLSLWFCPVNWEGHWHPPKYSYCYLVPQLGGVLVIGFCQFICGKQGSWQ